MDYFTHLSSIRDQLSSHALGVCKGIPVVITVPRENPSDIVLLNGESRNSSQPLAVLGGHSSPVVHLCISRDSDWLFSVSNESWLLWRIDSCLDKMASLVQASQVSRRRNGPAMSSCNDLMVSCFSPCSSRLFVSTGGGAYLVEVKSGECIEVDLRLLSPGSSGWAILSTAFCTSSCVAIGLEDRTFRICDLDEHVIIYQSSVFPASFTSMASTYRYLTVGTNEGMIKVFSLPGLLQKSCDTKSCDTVLHSISQSCDHDDKAIDESIVDLYTFEDEENSEDTSVSANRMFLIVVIRRCGLSFINGYNAEVLGELIIEDPVPSLVNPQDPEFVLPTIHNSSITRNVHNNEFILSCSGAFDGVVSVFKTSIGTVRERSGGEALSVVSSAPLSTDSVLRSPSLVPPQSKLPLSRCHPISDRSKKIPSVKDQPLTFKSMVKSSGYTQQPRMTMFNPSTKHSIREKKRDPLLHRITAISGGGVEPCNYGNMSRTHSFLLPERQPITNCLFTGDGSHLLYTVGKTLYAMKPHPSPAPPSRHFPLNGHDGDITGISGSHDNQWALTCSVDRTAKVWRVNHCAQQPLMNISSVLHNYKESAATLNRDNADFPGPINHCSFYYLDKFIILCYGNKISLMKYHLDTEKSHDIKRYLTKSHFKRVSLVSLDPSVKSVTSLSCINDFYSHLVYVAASDRSLHVYDMNEMNWVWSVTDAHKRPVNSIAQNTGSKFVSVSPAMSHDLFVTSAVGDGLKLWDTRTQRCVRWYTSYRNQSQPVSTSFSPCGQYIATGSEDRMVYLYDIRHLAPVEKLVCKTSIVSTLQYHPYKPLIVCGTLEGELDFFETEAKPVKQPKNKPAYSVR